MDEVDSHGFTSLMWACHYGQLPTARLLLQHRAKVNMEVSVSNAKCAFVYFSPNSVDLVKILRQSENVLYDVT